MARKKKQTDELTPDQIADLINRLSLSLTQKEHEENKTPVPGDVVVHSCGPSPWTSIARVSMAWHNRAQMMPQVGNLCLRECGSAGDCLFYALSHGLSVGVGEQDFQNNRNARNKMLTVRQWLAESLTPENVNRFIHEYQQEKWASEQTERHGGQPFWPTENATWRPEAFGSTQDLIYQVPGVRPVQILRYKYAPLPEFKKVLDVNDPNFQRFAPHLYPPDLPEGEKDQYSTRLFKTLSIRPVISRSGYSYQGDTTSLNYLVRGDNPFTRESIGFMILAEHGSIDCVLVPNDEVRNKYMLLYWLGDHWQLAGVATADNQVQVLFNRDDLPSIVKRLYLTDCGGVPRVLTS